jgi:hypothetical protein
VSEPEVALVFSPERWVEDLHRHCVDHGGARIRCVVMDPALALDEEYGVLVVSHRWPGLTVGFVEAVHARGRRVLGVLDPSEPAASRHLELVQVDGVVPADASMGEFVTAIADLAPDGAAASHLLGRAPGATGAPRPVGLSDGDRPIVVGGPAGAGRTELAIELTRRLGTADAPAVLVDADEVAPAVAARLGLPIEPNLRTAVDAVEYGLGSLAETLCTTERGALAALGGLPNVGSWSQLRPGEVLDVVHALRARHQHVVVDVGPMLEDVSTAGRGRFAITRALVEDAGALIGVGAGTPVGVIRLLAWSVDARALNPSAPIHLVISRAPTDAFRRGEISEEIVRTFPAASITFAPADRRVERASWEGGLVAPGPFTRAVASLAARLAMPTLARRGRSRARSRAEKAVA